MDIPTDDRSSASSFAPDACTLPTPEQPVRIAEFEALFAPAVRAVVRSSPASLRLVFDGDRATETTARELAARETECCSFFTFAFHPAGTEIPEGGLELTVSVPSAYVDVLDGLQRLAENAAQGPA